MSESLKWKHKIPIGTLVEIVYPGNPINGVRMLVCMHTKDCDGTPLYGLTWDLERYERYSGVTAMVCGGWDEQTLVVVTPGASSDATKDRVCIKKLRDGYKRLSKLYEGGGVEPFCAQILDHTREYEE